MRFLVLLLPSLLMASDSYRVSAPAIQQGQVLRLTATGPAISARMAGQTVRLFEQVDGGRSGLMPVPVRLPPRTYNIDFLDDNGRVISTADVRVESGRFPKQNITLSRRTASLKASPGEMETVSGLRNTISEVRHWEEPFAAPVPGCQTSPFGVQRLYNGKPSGSYHAGIDQRGPEGTPIHAIAAGTVRIARMFNVHGGTVGIDHGQGVVSTYLHMSRFAVNEGDTVRKGDPIGYVGSTGRSTAPHLHWGIAVNGVHVNPSQWVELKPCAAAPARSRRGVKRRR